MPKRFILGRIGALGSASDFGLRGPGFELPQRRRPLWPWGSHISTSQCVYMFLVTDKQNALRRECTFKIEIVLEIGMAGVNIYLKITVLMLSVVLALLHVAQSARQWRMIIHFYQ